MRSTRQEEGEQVTKKKFSWGAFFAGVGTVVGLNVVGLALAHILAKRKTATEPQVVKASSIAPLG